MAPGILDNYYQDDIEEGFVVCNICKAKLRNSRLSNLKRHLRTMHQVEVGTQKDVTICKTETKTKTKKKNIMIDISLSRLFRSYLGLVIDDNVPLTLLNSQNLRSIMNPICISIRKNIGKKIQLNAYTCEKALHMVAEDVRKSIKKELEHELLSIKVNAANSLSDNTFIVSAHFFKDDAMQTVTLGLVKFDAGRNPNKLTVEIIDTLTKYDIDLHQVVSITVENDTDVCLSSITTTFENSSGVPLEDIQICRCATRAAHLCCLDVASDSEIKEYLRICRNITLFINKSQYWREALVFNRMRVPQLDSESDWGSIYDMVSGLQSAKNILNDAEFVPQEIDGKQFEISSSLLDFIDCFTVAMSPLQKAIIVYQEDDLHYSHVYAQWLKCKLSTERIVQKNAATDNCLKYKIATIVLESMQHREISNECLHACLYLDPRFHRMLSPIQRTEGIRFLKKLWDKLSHLNPGDSIIGNNPTTAVTSDTDDQLLDQFLSESIHHKPAIDSVMVYSKIDCLQLPFMKSDTDVLRFWKDKKHIEPELYQLSNICFAIPPTQIISNSVSASLKLVTQSNHTCTNETLENILLIKLNSSYLDKAVMGSLPLFEKADEEKPNVHSDPLLLFEDGANSWPELDGHNFDMPSEDDNKRNTFFADPSNDGYTPLNIKDDIGKQQLSKKPKLSLESNPDINKISIKSENINSDGDSQLSNESHQECENSTAAHESSEDQSMEIPERKGRTRRKRAKKRSDFLCVECGKKFTLLHSFKMHMLRHEGNKKYECPQCPKTFVCSSGLYTHIKIHTSNKPYVCDVCARAFRTPHELKQHNRYHNGIKNFQCEYCDQRFVTGEKQRRHMRTHTGEKPYRCKYCDRAFAQSNDCNKHLKQHLGENIFQCELCPLRFPFVRDLRIHFATHKDDDEETRARYLEARELDERNLQTKLVGLNT